MTVLTEVWVPEPLYNTLPRAAIGAGLLGIATVSGALGALLSGALVVYGVVIVFCRGRL